MAFAGGKDGSKGFMKRITSTFSIRKKKNTTNDDPKLNLSRSKSTGSMRMTQGKKVVQDVTNTNTSNTKRRIKSAGVSPQQRREKIDEQQFMKMRCFDDSDSIWLSSDCASTSSALGERRVSVSFHFKVDEKIVSWLSNVAKSSLSLNQDSTKEHPPQHHRHQQHDKGSKKAKCSSEISRKDGKLFKLSSRVPQGTNNKTCPPRKVMSNDDLTSSPSLEEKKVSFSVETEKLTSPVNSTLAPSSSLEIGDSKRKIEPPLFWPFEQKFDWTPDDILKHFSMSPRRKKSLGTKSASTSPRSVRSQLQARKQDLKEGSKRKLMFNGPGSNSKPKRIPELRRTTSNSNNNNTTKKNENTIKNRVKRNKSLPSRLRKSNKVSSKVVPIETTQEETLENIPQRQKTPKKLIMTRKSRTFLEDDFALMNDFSIENAVGLCEFKGREDTMEETREMLKGQKTPKKLIMTRKSRTFLEDDFALMNDFSIENAVGLCEFKGREGIDSEYNIDGFLFDDSL